MQIKNAQYGEQFSFLPLTLVTASCQVGCYTVIVRIGKNLRTLLHELYFDIFIYSIVDLLVKKLLHTEGLFVSNTSWNKLDI